MRLSNKWATWLGEHGAAADKLRSMILRPYPAELMRAYPVALRVGNVRNNDPAAHRNSPLQREETLVAKTWATLAAKRLLTCATLALLVTCSVLHPDAALSETIQLHKQGGTYLIPVRINDAITLNFLLDTGASEVTIPADVFLTLMRSNTVEQSDFRGDGRYVLADGSEQVSKRFRLRSVRVGEHVLSDVIASVAPVQSNYPLLGQSFLSKLSTWSIDNQRGMLILSDGAVQTATMPLNALDVVRSFYSSLGDADGSRASALVIPEKRITGPFSPGDLSRFYGNLAEPLRLTQISLTAPNVVAAEYTYVLPNGRRCAGKSLVYVTLRSSGTFIERIRALAGC